MINNLYGGNEAYVKEAELTDFELYNMKEDISEADNVAKKYPEVLEEMKELLASEYAALLEDSHIWSRDVQN
jgi:arylsulfatase A